MVQLDRTSFSRLETRQTCLISRLIVMSSPPVSSDKRQRIIETAYTLFKSDGFHATGIDRIIAEADVAKMTMYRHFPNKDGLIVAVLEYRARLFDRQLDALAKKSVSSKRKIETIFDWYERWFLRDDFHGCLFAHALAEFGDAVHPVFQAASQQKNDLKYRLRKILEEAMPRNRAEPISSALLMLIEGATLMAEMGQGKAAIRHARKAAGAIIGAPGTPS